MKRLFFIALLLLISCKPAETPHATPIVKDTELCASAETNLIKLDCEEGKPTKKGTSFKDFCEDVQINGMVFLNPKCLANIKSCDEIDVCTGSK